MQRQIIRQMQKKVTQQLEKMQEDLESSVVEGNAGGDLVVVKMNGKQEIISIKIKPEIVNPQEVDVLEDLVTLALRDALNKVSEQQTSMMSSLTGGLNLPPGMF